MKLRNSHLAIYLLLFFAILSCSKEKDDDPVVTPVTPEVCYDDAHIGYTSLATDVCKDGAISGLLDGTRLEYNYDALKDSIYFLISVNSLSDTQAIGVNVMINILSGDTARFNFWGNDNTDAYNRLLTVWVTGTAPSAYTGTIGVCDNAGVMANNFTSLSQNNISINVSSSAKTILLGIGRMDLIPDNVFIGNSISVKIAAAVGSNQYWNDDIYNAASLMTITKFNPTLVIPTVTTNIVSNTTTNLAICGGNVTDDGGANVIARGVAFATHANPTVADEITSDGSGIGTFNSLIDSLSPGTLYYVRAYAQNSVGIAYGNEVTFSTLPSVPIVSTINVMGVTSSEAEIYGEVISDQGATVTARGFAYSVTPGPTISNSPYINAGSGIGTFSSIITSLSPTTSYFVRAYAENSEGVAYGDELTFTTGLAPAQVMPLDSIRLLDPGTGNVILPFNRKISVTVTSDYSTVMTNNQNIYAQDNTGGILVRFDAPHNFPVWTLLEIDISNINLINYNGILEINDVPLANAQVLGSLPVSAISTNINGIDVNYSTWESMLVTIPNVTISGSGTYSGSNTLSDGINTIVLYTSHLATFATNPYPVGIVTVTGILSEFNGVKQILMRNPSDVQ